MASGAEQLPADKFIAHHEGIGLHRDGRRIPLLGSGSPVKNAAGELIAISMILRDVSDLKEAERDRALLASIVEFSEDAIVSLRLDGTVVSWNCGAENLLGYTQDEMIGEKTDVLVRKERVAIFREFIAGVRQGHAVAAYDTTVRAKGGGAVEVSVSLSPIRDSSGDVVAVSAILRDVGKRVQAERKLRDSEARFREVFEEAPVGVCVTAMDGRFLQVNAALCRMLGYSAQELREFTWMELTHRRSGTFPGARRGDAKDSRELTGPGEAIYPSRWIRGVGAHARLAGPGLRR